MLVFHPDISAHEFGQEGVPEFFEGANLENIIFCLKSIGSVTWINFFIMFSGGKGTVVLAISPKLKLGWTAWTTFECKFSVIYLSFKQHFINKELIFFGLTLIMASAWFTFAGRISLSTTIKRPIVPAIEYKMSPSCNLERLRSRQELRPLWR